MDNQQKAQERKRRQLEAARERLDINGRLVDYLKGHTEERGNLTYNCPICGSGTGKKGTPALHVTEDGTRWKCFACDNGGDIYDLIGLLNDTESHEQQIKIAADYFGVSIDDILNSNGADDWNQQPKAADTFKATAAGQPVKKEKEAEPLHDLTQETDEAHRELLSTPAALEHFAKRGLSVGTLKRFKIGYHHAGHNDILRNNTAHYSKSQKIGLYRFIFPYLDTNGRAIYFISEIADRAEIDAYNPKYRKINNTPAPAAFNISMLQVNPPQVVFIVEGIYDALSIEEIGRHAIALTGTGSRGLIKEIATRRPDTAFIIVPDNDGPGETAANKLAKELDKLQQPYIIKPIDTKPTTAGGVKDCNEALTHKGRGYLEQWAADATDEAQRTKEAAQAEAEAQEEAEREAYRQTAADSYIDDFINGIAASVNTSYTPTGFRILDNVLDGGLYEGLYIVGAISSLGKTTFALQMADQIAAQGQDVLIFSLEMARAELMAKSISRLTLIDTLNNNGELRHAKTARGITTGTRWAKYCQQEKQLIGRAVQGYNEYAQHVYIYEGVGDIGAEEIKEAVKRHIHFTGTRPVVFIDYLQILAPYDLRASDKQNVDKAVLELKRLSRDYKIPVFGVSSLNRDNYKAVVNMAAFKESGSLEYSSDVLIGLQLKGTGREGFNVDDAKQKDPREIELKILKNRNGATGDTIEFEYFPMFNYFKEKRLVKKENKNTGKN